MSDLTTSTHPTPVLGQVPDRVQAEVRTLMTTGHVPGLSLAVVTPERLLLASGFGAADLASGAPATAGTTYLWFSMSKIVTATAAMRLVDEGRLDLDAPAHEYVDVLRRRGATQPTVRQLLDHTAGLANPMPIRWAHAAGEEGQDADELLARLMSRRRAYRYEVGATARYSNLGYLAAGAVISAASGRPFGEYVTDCVLVPTGMARTGFSYQPGSARATGYVRAPRVAGPVLRRLLPRGIAGDWHGRCLALNPFYVDGPAYGGLVGDVLDVARFLQLHLRDGELGGHRVISSEGARAMRGLDRAGTPFDHGIGWFRRPTNGRGDWVEHFGAGAGFWNVMRAYPDRGIGIVAMTNSTTTFDFEPLFDVLAGSSWS